jgi:putative endonuclease
MCYSNLVKSNPLYYAYIVECSDGTYYTGQTDNLALRLKEHNGDYPKKGAVYTRTRRPVRLGHFETFETRSKALKREYEIKKLKHIEKKVICEKGKKIGFQ